MVSAPSTTRAIEAASSSAKACFQKRMAIRTITKTRMAWIPASGMATTPDPSWRVQTLDNASRARRLHGVLPERDWDEGTGSASSKGADLVCLRGRPRAAGASTQGGAPKLISGQSAAEGDLRRVHHGYPFMRGNR
jgi:hypothetical protein